MKLKVTHKYPMWSRDQIRRMVEDNVIVKAGDGMFILDPSRLLPIHLTPKQIENLEDYPKIENER